jgi:hypothetical protein
VQGLTDGYLRRFNANATITNTVTIAAIDNQTGGSRSTNAAGLSATFRVTDEGAGTGLEADVVGAASCCIAAAGELA